MAKVLGWKPEKATMIVSVDADLVFRLPATTDTGVATTWPVGTTSYAELFDSEGEQVLSIAGLVEDSGIDFVAQSEQVNPIIDEAMTFRVYVSLPETPTQEYLLYFGSVKRED